jgi:hypothetical protein
MTAYAPARWLPGAHAMTVFASAARLLPRPRGARERLELPDGDFVDVDRFTAQGGARAPVVAICHGLEGSSTAPYVRGLVSLLLARGLSAAALNFRGCSGVLNRLPRFYHSGDTGDLAALVDHLVREAPGRPVLVAGFSLGGNVVVKYLGERGDELPPEVVGGAAISVPFDLRAAAYALDAPGFWNFVYRERFLRRLRAKALAKARRFPEAIDAARVLRATTFAGFDGLVTAPMHGFASADDYWTRCSAARFVGGVRRCLLAISAMDDPIVPGPTLPLAAIRANPAVTLELTEAGGHVAFVAGGPFWPSYWAEARAADFLASLSSAASCRARPRAAPSARASAKLARRTRSATPAASARSSRGPIRPARPA